MRWMRILLGGASAAVLSMASVFLTILAYAAKLMFQAGASPDPSQIALFAGEVHLIEPVLAIALALVFAVWVARETVKGAALHAVLVGLVAAVFLQIEGLAFGGTYGLIDLVTFTTTIAACWLAGVFTSRHDRRHN